MPATHPYWRAFKAELFKELAVVKERARTHKMTIRTHGKADQPKRFALKRRGDPDPILWTAPNSLREIERFLDRLDGRG